METLYHENGFVDAGVWFRDPAPFVIALGGRGTGKTFGALEYLTRNDAQPFVYLRRTQAQLDACKIPELNPFKSVNAATGRDFIVKPSGKYTAAIQSGDRVCGLAIALSVFANIRGVDGLGYRTLLYDEFIKESHERPIRNEGDAFLNCYETLNRNRELQGQQPLKAILLANTNDLRSPVIESLGLLSVLEKMQRRGQQHTVAAHGNISVYLYRDSPISDRKRATALYQIADADGDFTHMALDNSFAAANYERVRSCPLAEYTPVVSIGSITVYRSKATEDYYVVAGKKSDVWYSEMPIDLKAFRRDYYYLYDALLNRCVWYASAAVKVKFERVWQ